MAKHTDEATATSSLGNPATMNLRQSRDVLEQIALINQAVERFDPASAARAHLLSTRDRLAGLLTASREGARPLAEETATVAEPSGPSWVLRFSSSASPEDCIEPFRSNLKAFLVALTDAGAQVDIAATYRPPERAYLMHWSWKIARNLVDPRAVPAMSSVGIDWVHRTTSGDADIPKSRSAASQMVSLYGTVAQPALASRHTERRAVDMDISWTGSLPIRNADGTANQISTKPRSGMNDQLIALGGGYGVIKAQFAGDPPHWSEDGH
jgi:hypothetical protein